MTRSASGQWIWPDAIAKNTGLTASSAQVAARKRTSGTRSGETDSPALEFVREKNLASSFGTAVPALENDAIRTPGRRQHAGEGARSRHDSVPR